MIIKTLVENTAISNDFKYEHGLSLYIETKERKILFDVGTSGIFIENAKKLDVEIKDIHYLIISHGHYDHGGGLRLFLDKNTDAKVFLRQLAFEEQYAKRANKKLEFVGLEKELKENKRLVFTSDNHIIYNGIEVFSAVEKVVPYPISNSGLYTRKNGEIVKDTFLHEQNLIIEEDGRTLLITGCAHNGIINILEHFKKLKGHMPDYVVGGFHLSSRSGGDESPKTIDKISDYLIKTNAKYYTCHCTGLEQYKRLKANMGDSIDYIKTGSIIKL
ncbi:MAG TPA: MBL fold metallo-hydrolase [Clostridia bacterium]|nr:MBL fold metallo-hydrolase [Clostridia bacterium]